MNTDQTNQTAGQSADTKSRQFKKYSCADVDAELADRIAPRAKMLRIPSGMYLSHLLRDAFEREDKLKVTNPRDWTMVDARETGRAVVDTAPTPPPAAAPAPPPPTAPEPRYTMDPEQLDKFAAIAERIAALRAAGAGDDLIGPLMTTFRAGLTELRKKP